MKKLPNRNEPERANPPPQEVANPPNVERLNREQIKQEIRELDSLELDSTEMRDFVYHRINVLLEMLDNEP